MDGGVSCLSDQLGNHKLTTWTLDTFLGLYDNYDADKVPSFETRILRQLWPIRAVLSRLFILLIIFYDYVLDSYFTWDWRGKTGRDNEYLEASDFRLAYAAGVAYLVLPLAARFVYATVAYPCTIRENPVTRFVRFLFPFDVLISVWRHHKLIAGRHKKKSKSKKLPEKLQLKEHWWAVMRTYDVSIKSCGHIVLHLWLVRGFFAKRNQGGNSIDSVRF